MNVNDIVVFGKWYGDGYGEHFAIARDINPNDIDLRYTSGDQIVSMQDVKNVEDVSEGEDYWRAVIPTDFTDQAAISGQVVWVSYAREESNSQIYQGIVIGSPEAFAGYNTPLRVIFGRRTRTLLSQSQAGSCDNFWAVEEPTPVYCDDD